MPAPCLWFSTQADEAARYYTSIFPNSRILSSSPVVTMFDLNGSRFTALNGNREHAFNPSVSFVISCADQAEIDFYWERLGAGGDPTAQQCGWLKDRFGVSWQVIPANLGELLGRGGKAAMDAMLSMRKLDIAVLRAAGDV